MELKTGIKGSAEARVTEDNTAKAVGSGELRVFATPCMLALMEKAAQSVAPFLDEGQSTVGTRAEFTHDAATPVGMTVRAESELVSVDGRKLTFKVTACDSKGLPSRSKRSTIAEKSAAECTKDLSSPPRNF